MENLESGIVLPYRIITASIRGQLFKKYVGQILEDKDNDVVYNGMEKELYTTSDSSTTSGLGRRKWSSLCFHSSSAYLYSALDIGWANKECLHITNAFA